MGLVFRFNGVAVYVHSEQGHWHSQRHAHVQRKGDCLGTFFLPSLDPVGTASKDLPNGILEEMQARMDDLIAECERLGL